jgi:aryl-alcohol dehydrogenase-like predicted oxidoreductase
LILDAIRRSRLNVAQIDFHYVHCVQWDTFLPKSLRFLANWVDKGYVLRNPKASNIFMFRLQRGV